MGSSQGPSSWGQAAAGHGILGAFLLRGHKPGLGITTETALTLQETTTHIL